MPKTLEKYASVTPLTLTSMEDNEQEFFLGSAYAVQSPSIAFFPPFSPSASPSARRLSSRFTHPSRHVRAGTKRQLAWVSLQGRLVGAEEATSAKTIGGGLTPQEAVAWELFSPIHRILLVAIIAVAAANSKKNKQISQLQKSVQLRDQVLSSMQQKLDNLCEQLTYFKDQPESNISITKELERKIIGCGCQLCDQHKLPPNISADTSLTKACNGDEIFNYKISLAHGAEPEERRMSDLSDWAPSVSSSVDMQLNTLATKQDIYSLRKECEEKNATIKELSGFLYSSETMRSKRITELEDIIRRKNMIITKLKKDILVLEQKVVGLTRLRRPSFSASIPSTRPLPVMADNLLYDMDSTTSPSSSDSDCSPRNQAQASVTGNMETIVKNNVFALKGEQETVKQSSSTFSVKSHDQHHLNCRPVSPLKEKSLNQILNSITTPKAKQWFPPSRDPKSRREAPNRSKDGAQRKRWV